MHLKYLKLINFRNYGEQEVTFHPRLNLIIGNNAQGKTNLIEAIYYLSMGKSHRTAADRELIRWECSSFYIKGEISVEGRTKTIEVGLASDGKKVKINGVNIKRRGELLGNLSNVIFSPEELKLVREGPSYRRRFLDMEIIQIRPSYYYTLRSYNKVLFQRNSLLKEIATKRYFKDTLAVWDSQLASYGAKIIYMRSQFIKKISALSRLVHRKITSDKEELEIKYNCCLDDIEGYELTQIKEALAEHLVDKRDRDIRLGTTTFGPHREDLEIRINGTDVRKFGSQGQQRTAALSMKLSEIEIIRGETGSYPVLLLDDVMSELDPSRQLYLVENLEQVQVFITSTYLSSPMKKKLDRGKVFTVKNGIIIPVNN